MTATSRPRLLFVSARFTPDVGGIETHVAEVAPRLVEMGFDVTILTTDRTGTRASSEKTNGVEVVRVPAYPRSRDYYLAPALVGEIRRHPSDLMHLQGYHTLVAPIAMAAAGSRGLPYVVSFHSGGHPSKLRNRARALQRLLLRPGLVRADRLIAVSRFELDLFRRDLRLSASRFKLIRNGSSLPAPLTTRRPGAGLVVSIGRLERYKGHRRVVEAWGAVLREVPHARLRIIGSGPDEGPIRALIRSSGMEDRITLESIPGDDRQAIADALGEANLVVLLSDYEAHPVAVMEALAVATPVLVARTSGLTELVEDGLAAGIDPSASMAQVAAGVVAELRRPRVVATPLPTWDDCAVQLRDLYHEILEGRR
ncbi:MAG TPA: glycosyltransferase family 4 protein [Candidatus Dormibacteraeota bacterium]|nr:glycosyltransferase family 4 protein [Candidatus Dormibacteraeota bacterium]